MNNTELSYFSILLALSVITLAIMYTNTINTVNDIISKVEYNEDVRNTTYKNLHDELRILKLKFAHQNIKHKNCKVLDGTTGCIAHINTKEK